MHGVAHRWAVLQGTVHHRVARPVLESTVTREGAGILMH